MPSSPLSAGVAVRAFAVFAAGYFMSYGLRTVQAVIAPLLTEELHLASGDLGLLSSAYLLSFALMQLPLGWWLDRHGSRRVESALLLIAAVGCAVFAVSRTLPMLFLGRALVGAGVSACLMAAYTFYRRWMPMERQGQLAAMMLVAGTAGALASTLPVAWLAAWLGWRGVFWVCAAVFAALAVAVFTVLPRSTDPVPHPAGSLESGYRDVFAHPAFLQSLPLGVFTQGGLIALQSLWLGPWLHRVVGLEGIATGEALFVYNLVVLVSYVAVSVLTARRPGLSLARLFVPGFGAIAVLLPIGIVWTAPESRWLWAVLALGVPATAMLQTHVALGFPKQMAGRAYTAFNLVVFVGAFAVQWGLGVTIDLFEAAGIDVRTAHQASFAALWAAQLGALAWYGFRRPAAAPASA